MLLMLCPPITVSHRLQTTIGIARSEVTGEHTGFNTAPMLQASLAPPTSSAPSVRHAFTFGTASKSPFAPGGLDAMDNCLIDGSKLGLFLTRSPQWRPSCAD